MKATRAISPVLVGGLPPSSLSPRLFSWVRRRRVYTPASAGLRPQIGLESLTTGHPAMQRSSTLGRQAQGGAEGPPSPTVPADRLTAISPQSASRRSSFRRSPAPRSFGSLVPTSDGLAPSDTAFRRAFVAYSNHALALMQLPLLVTQLPTGCHPHRMHQDFPS